jgi:hypothetical protein
LCPSCIAKRSALFAEQLREKILAPVGHRHVVFTIPKALRGLFERERRLLGLLVRSAYDAVKTCFQEILGRRDALPGFVAAIQTFGSFAANFHPHLHVLVTDGLLAEGGDFVALPSLDTGVLTEVFRRLVLDRLLEAERLSERFHDTLLGWTHSGFHAYAGPPVSPSDPDRLERLARYLTRPPLAMGSVSLTPEGQVLVTTPPDPRTGSDVRILDPLEFVHALTNQIPDAGSHTIRYLGAYATRIRKTHVIRKADPTRPAPEGATAAPDEDDAFTKSRRSSWARILRKVLEVDPKICSRRGSDLKIVAVITDPRTVDRILRHVESGRGHDPFEPRAPQAVSAG